MVETLRNNLTILETNLIQTKLQQWNILAKIQAIPHPPIKFSTPNR